MPCCRFSTGDQTRRGPFTPTTVFSYNRLEGEVYLTNTFTSGRFASRILPGLSIEVSWFWTEPLPNPLECLKAATE